MNRSNSVEPEFLTTLPTSGGRRAARRLRDGVWLAPRALGAVHPRFQTPHMAIVLQMVWASILALWGGIDHKNFYRLLDGI